MELIHTSSYDRAIERIQKLGASNEEVWKAENEIALTPEAGDLIPGAGGLRKLRFGYGRKGKRGGARTIYYVMSGEGQVILVTAYAKVDKSDLTAAEKKLFVDLIKELDNG